MSHVTASWIKRFATRLIHLQPKTYPLDAVRNATVAYRLVAELTPEDAADICAASASPLHAPAWAK